MILAVAMGSAWAAPGDAEAVAKARADYEAALKGGGAVAPPPSSNAAKSAGTRRFKSDVLAGPLPPRDCGPWRHL